MKQLLLIKAKMVDGIAGIVILAKRMASLSNKKPSSGLSNPALAILGRDSLECVFNQVDKARMVLKVRPRDDWLDFCRDPFSDVEPW